MLGDTWRPSDVLGVPPGLRPEIRQTRKQSLAPVGGRRQAQAGPWEEGRRSRLLSGRGASSPVLLFFQTSYLRDGCVLFGFVCLVSGKRMEARCLERVTFVRGHYTEKSGAMGKRGGIIAPRVAEKHRAGGDWPPQSQCGSGNSGTGCGPVRALLPCCMRVVRKLLRSQYKS